MADRLIWAVVDGDGAPTGASYDAVTDTIRAHHARLGQTLAAASALIVAEDGWVLTPATSAQIAATLTVSRFQARAALMQAGRLEAVEKAVSASNDPLVRLAWADSVEFPRTSPTIAALAKAIGLTDADLDALFIAASQISA